MFIAPKTTALALFFCLSIVACDVPLDEKCPDGFTLRAGACEVVTVMAPPDLGPDLPSSDDVGEMGDVGDMQASLDMAPDVGNTPFGAVCVTDDHSDCSGETDFCNKQPGMTEGYCSAKGCDADASICPDGWTCFNLGQFDASLPWVCVE